MAGYTRLHNNIGVADRIFNTVGRTGFRRNMDSFQEGRTRLLIFFSTSAECEPIRKISVMAYFEELELTTEKSRWKKNEEKTEREKKMSASDDESGLNNFGHFYDVNVQWRHRPLPLHTAFPLG